MDLSKAKYLVPNSLTLASVFCGLSSIYQSMTAHSSEQIVLAAWLIVVAMLCDLFDGRLARIADAQSDFGVQLDSLADGVSFGVAPAMLLFSWGLEPLGMGGMFIAFIFAGCALMRLARFNVMSTDSGGKTKYFTGLPTPLAAGAVVSVVLAHVNVTGKMATGAYWNAAVMTMLFGGLMVSNVRYRTFKDVNFRGRAGVFLVALVASVATLAVVARPSVAFVTIMVLYVVIGLGGGIVELGRNIFGSEHPEVEEEYLVEAHEEER